MIREAMAIVDSTDRRRTPTKEFSDHVAEFIDDMISLLEDKGREVTSRTVFDAMCLYGPERFGGMDGFILEVYQECGKQIDVGSYLEQIDYRPGVVRQRVEVQQKAKHTIVPDSVKGCEKKGRKSAK